MTFALTDSLTDQILFCMENQESVYAVDAAEGKTVEIQSDAEADEENIYSIPSWTSDDGFELMEAFANSLHHPMAKNELKTVLASRRGVFKNFKNVLKAYPEVEKKWFLFKNKEMKSHVAAWYNDLCVSWGLEQLEQVSSDSEDTDELVEDDFEFSEYDSLKDGESVERARKFFREELVEQYFAEAGSTAAFLHENLSTFAKEDEKSGFVCRSISSDFLGCALVSRSPDPAKKTVVFTDFFVVQNYRGLGIGKKLLENCLSILKQRGIQFVIFSNSIMPESMESLLIQFPFEKKDFGFILDLLKE